MEKLHCKFCNFSTNKFYRNKKGTPCSGYKRLEQHVEFQHPEEYDKIMEALHHETETAMELNECHTSR